MEMLTHSALRRMSRVGRGRAFCSLLQGSGGGGTGQERRSLAA